MMNAPANPDGHKPPLGGRFEAARAAFKPAIRHVGVYMFYGLIIGSILLSYQFIIESYTDNVWWLRFGRLLEHLGAGFVVSSIAVFLYEWGSEAKHLIEITERLTKLADDEILPIINAAAHNFLDVMLKRLAPTSESIHHSFRGILQSYIDIETCRAWNKRVYLGFFERALLDLEKIATDSAQFATEETRQFRLTLPEAGALATRLLCDQIELLNEGDSYHALSDVDSWRSLETFVDAQRRAVTERGVSIRRIFLVPKEANQDTSKTIAQHSKLAAEWSPKTADTKSKGRYDLRVTTAERLPSAAKTLQHDKHFGIFTRHAEATAVAFEVVRDDLSELSLSAVTKDSSLARDYEKLWSHLAKQKFSDIADILLASTVHALGHGWRYVVVSDFQSWEGLETFHAACISAMADRRLSIHRIFVRQPTDEKRLVRRVLKRHFATSESFHPPGGTYEIRFCEEKDAVAVFGEPWQFGFFLSPGGQSEAIGFAVAESSEGGVSNYYMDSVSARESYRVEQFEEFWKTLPVFVDSTIPSG